MNTQNFTTTIVVDKTPNEVYDAINKVREWWTGDPGIEGSTDKIGDEFIYRYEKIHYSKQRVTELIPGKKVTWLVLDSALTFIEDESEWNGTKITFDIAKKGNRTEVRFTHIGLVPEVECYDACSKGWSYYINDSLRSFLTIARAA